MQTTATKEPLAELRVVELMQCEYYGPTSPLIHSPPTENQLGRNQGYRNGDHVKNSEAKGCWIEWTLLGDVVECISCWRLQETLDEWLDR